MLVLGYVYVGVGPYSLVEWAALQFFGLSLLYALPDCAFCLVFPLVFKYMSRKTLFFQDMWKYVNSKCVCVISLFISPILSLNWRLDLIVKDRQQRRHRQVSGEGGSGTIEGRDGGAATVVARVREGEASPPTWLEKGRSGGGEGVRRARLERA